MTLMVNMHLCVVYQIRNRKSCQQIQRYDLLNQALSAAILSYVISASFQLLSMIGLYAVMKGLSVMD